MTDGDASALAQRWTEHAQSYIDGLHWRKASVTLEESDPRVLLLGPGPNSDLYIITQALELFLAAAGFAVHRLDEDLAPDSNRSRAVEYERVAAVPVTVGSTVEVFDLLVEDRRNGGKYGLRHRIKVVLPQNYSTGYFARVLTEDLGVTVRFCDPLGPDVAEVPAGIGGLLLKRLAEELNTTRGQRRSLARTEQAPEPSNLQAREVADYPPELERPVTLAVNRDLNIHSPHSAGGSAAGGRDATGGSNAVASDHAQVVTAERGSQAAAGGGRASSGAPSPDKEAGSPAAAVIFGLILIGSLITLLAGVGVAIVGIIVGVVGAGVAVYRLYKGT